MADVSQIKLPNGSVYDLIDEKSGYITAEYIENKTDYEIPVSRVGEIVVGETAIGTDSTNFPTSKAVVDYVDERVVQEINAIDFESGVTGIKANGTSLNVVDGVVNIPAIGPNQSVGLITEGILDDIYNDIPTSTSQLTNDSGFITASDIPTQNISWANYRLNTIGTAWDLYPLGDNATSGSSNTFKISTGFHLHEVGGTTVSSVLHIGDISSKRIGGIRLYDTQYSGTFQLGNSLTTSNLTNNRIWNLPDKTGTVALTSDIPTVPTNISSFTNDSGYLTASDIASVMTYKGTKANYTALPSTGNTTGDVWHLTDTGAEWAWDGSAWQELGTAIDLSNYLTTSDIAAWAKASTKPTYTAAEVGAISTSHVVNGITSTDISNWNAKSSTDEKVKATALTFDDSTHYPIFGNSSGNAETKNYTNAFTIGASSTYNHLTLQLGNANTLGRLQLYRGGGDSNRWTVIAANLATGNRTITLPDKTGTVALTSDIPDTSSFLTSETDPVFSASAAAGITSTDISNWNAKVSDTGKWNGVELANFETATANDYYVPAKTTVGSTSGTASWLKVTRTPGNYSIAQYDNGYLKSTTPSANDNSTKVATTAYVDAAIPKVYSSTNTGGYLTMATLPIYDGTVE